MNENIKNLWDTALEEFSKEHQFATIMLPAPLREKFAELIIKKCAVMSYDLTMAEVTKLSVPPIYKSTAQLVANECEMQIKEYFGINE